MSRPPFAVFLLLILPALSLAQIKPAQPRVAVLELFTSEGCSSCPPADELALELGLAPSTQNVTILPLGFHVDYWNHLGWTDPFSSPAFSARQAHYEAVLGKGVFTPQAVVNGEVSVIGSDAQGLRAALAQTRAASVRLAVDLQTVNPGSVVINVLATPAAPHLAPIGVELAVTESNLTDKVTSGENSGRTLRLAPVVRWIRALGSLGDRETRFSTALEFPKEWKLQNVQVVVLARELSSQRICGARAQPLER